VRAFEVEALARSLSIHPFSDHSTNPSHMFTTSRRMSSRIQFQQISLSILDRIYHNMTHPTTEIVTGTRFYPIVVGVGCCILFGTIPSFISTPNDVRRFDQSRKKLYNEAIHQIDTFWKRGDKRSLTTHSRSPGL
jgi:hypothetical protein